MDNFDLIPKSLKNSCKTLDANRGSLSLTIESGNPNLLYTLSIRSIAMSFSLAVFCVGMIITPFVRPWSTTDSIESNPLLSGKSVIKSHVQFANGRVDSAAFIGFSVGFARFRFILYCWHVAHPLQ